MNKILSIHTDNNDLWPYWQHENYFLYRWKMEERRRIFVIFLFSKWNFLKQKVLFQKVSLWKRKKCLEWEQLTNIRNHMTDIFVFK